ncbi:hypothetical protein P3T20_002586 [Paraburkholderia sp. GAS206C]|jgi:hypothetical protein
MSAAALTMRTAPTLAADACVILAKRCGIRLSDAPVKDLNQ